MFHYKDVMIKIFKDLLSSTLLLLLNLGLTLAPLILSLDIHANNLAFFQIFALLYKSFQR